MSFKIQHPGNGEFWCGAQLSSSDSSVYEVCEGSQLRNINSGLYLRYLADRVLYESDHADYNWFIGTDGKISTNDGFVTADGNSLRIVSEGPCVNWKIIPFPEPEAPAPAPEPETPAPAPEPETPSS